MTTSQEPTNEHEIFGPYEVYERLGVGGMATVHRAKENGIEGFERIVALKRLLPHLAEDASFVRSFVREAKLASMLQHANIVQLYELGRVGPMYFISMEHIDGKDIRKILRQARRVTGPPPLSVFLSLMIQLCDALDYAHRRCDQNGEPLGLVHRDVSPSNLLVTESGHLKVIDFGIARAQSQHLRTQTGRIKGKLAYMAPEAIKGQELDARSDIFSCGVIAHELLTARPLFATKNEYETLLRVQRGEVAIPSTINSSCPPELDDMVLKALARDPNKRWGSAAELRDALHYLRAQYQVSATNREVCTWMEWAFTREAADTRSFAAVTTGVSESISVVSGSYSSAPQNAFAPSRATTIRLGSVATALEPEAEPLPPPPVSSGVPLVRGDSDDSGDEEAVEFAWGCQEDEAEDGEPLLLDEVPDVSCKLVAVELPSSSRRQSSEFGSAIVHERHRRTMRMSMVAGILALAVAGLSVYLVVSKSGDAGSGDLAASHTASIKFAIEPADATIDILGYGVHDGSPYKLEVQAPGTYRIEVKRHGYKSYVTELEVDSGESHVVRVALDTGGSDKAQVSVRSTPAGHMVFIDGVASERRTPANLELAPGAHVISIKDDGDRELWQHEFTASGNTQYEFHPELLNEDKQRRREERRMSEHRSLAQPDPAPGPKRPEQAVVEIPVVAEPAMREPQELAVVASISAGSRSALDSLATPTAATLEVPKAPPPVANRGPVTIPPNLAKKRSGEMPRLPKVSSGEVPSHASAKLCIDSKGRVASATVLTPMPNSIKLALRRSLERWRYAPYEEGGEAVGACFAVNFKIAN